MCLLSFHPRFPFRSSLRSPLRTLFLTPKTIFLPPPSSFVIIFSLITYMSKTHGGEREMWRQYGKPNIPFFSLF
jgi:hypothetical protein